MKARPVYVIQHEQSNAFGSWWYDIETCQDKDDALDSLAAIQCTSPHVRRRVVERRERVVETTEAE